VPGLIAFARWSLLAPFVVLEEDYLGDALSKSSEVVRGHTGSVLAIVGVTFLAFAVPPDLVSYVVLGKGLALDAFVFAWSSLTAPFEAHVLSVVYYRLRDPERPVIHENVLRWRSAWAGA
jgi:hypothetical protein